MKKRLSVFGGITVFFALILLTFSLSLGVASEKGKEAHAARQKVMTIKQDGHAVYCGSNFININGVFVNTGANSDVFENELFDTLSFFLDGVKFEPEVENVRVAKGLAISSPGTYSLNFTVVYEDVGYSASGVPVAIDKKAVTVTTLLNGSSYSRVTEGEKVSVAYDYSGAVSDHTEQTTMDGVPVTRLKNTYMNSPAYVDSIPKQPIENYKVVASHADSDFYVFNYVGATLTIDAKNVDKLEISTENGVLLTLIGTFSTLYSVEYADIGINPSGTEYASINARAVAAYGNLGLFDEYERAGCYTVSVLSDKNVVNVSVPAVVKIKADNLTKGKKYKVVALYRNSTVKNEVLDAVYDSGYLMFSAQDVGDFLVVSEINGLAVNGYIIAIVVGIAVLVVVLILVAVFRKKY